RRSTSGNVVWLALPVVLPVETVAGKARHRRTAQARCSIASTNTTAEDENHAATRSASTPPMSPPRVPIPLIRPKTVLADLGSNDSFITDQNPERRIAPNDTTCR